MFDLTERGKRPFLSNVFLAVAIDSTTYEPPQNKPLLIHVWATWCPTCKVEASNIQRVSNNYEVLTIAVSSGSNTKIKRYLDDNELNFRVVNDSNGVIAKQLKVSAFPTTFVYSSDKKLKFSEVGYTTTAGLLSRMALVN